MTINNTAERRLSILQFASLFAAALVLCCFAFTKSFSLQKEIPAEELNLLREKQKVVQKLGELGAMLREYETEQLTGSLNIDTKEAQLSDKMVGIRGALLYKDTLGAYNDVQKLLDMTAQYRLFIKRSAIDGDNRVKEMQRQLAQLQQQNLTLQFENSRIQLESQSAALAARTAEADRTARLRNVAPEARAAAAVVHPATNGAPAQPVANAATPPVAADCDAQIHQVRIPYQTACASMHTSLSEILSDVENISTGILGGISRQRKTHIENNINQVQRQIERLSQ